MKSVMQEASSIAKAVEQAWDQAGKPQEFTVKVLEHPQKNFIGFTTRSAKVALFFEEGKRAQEPQRGKRPLSQQAKPQREPREGRGEQQREAAPREPREQRETREPREGSRPQRESRPPRDMRERREPRGERRRPEGDMTRRQEEPAGATTYQWNESLIEVARRWLNNELARMSFGHVQFTVEPNGSQLRIALYEHLSHDPEKERQLLAGFSSAIMEVLRKESSSELKGHRVMVTHATAYEKHAV